MCFGTHDLARTGLKSKARLFNERALFYMVRHKHFALEES